MTETKLTTTEKRSIAVENPQCAWGSEGVDTDDVKIPVLLMMQGLSDFVADGKAAMGDIVHSQTEKVIGGSKDPVRFIPLYSFKTHEYSEKEGNKWMRKHSEPYDKAVHAKLTKFGETDQGVEYRNEAVLNFYTMLESELDEADALPCLLRCRRTSMNAGKKLITYFKQCQMKNVPPASSVFTLTTTKTQNDLGTFYVMDLCREKATEEKYIPKLYEWYRTITSGDKKIQIDEGVEDTGNSDDVPF